MKPFTAAMVLSCCVAFFANAVRADDKPEPKPRLLSVAQMMSALIKPKFVDLKTGLEKEGLTEEDWKKLATDAALLHESSFNLVQAGRSKDEIWKKATFKMRFGSKQVIEKIEAQDAKGALKAYERIAQSCKDCHTEHKYKK